MGNSKLRQVGVKETASRREKLKLGAKMPEYSQRPGVPQ